MSKKKLDYKVAAVKQGDDLVTSVNCTPAELMGIIQHLVGVFADGAGITYNEVLDDFKEKED